MRGAPDRSTEPVTSAGAPIVGRDRELVIAARLVDAARSGSGGALLVTGEAGIGKSRLLSEVDAMARAAGFAVLAGRAVPGAGTYRAVAEAVLGHVRSTRVADSPQLRPFRAALGRLAPGWTGSEVGTGMAGPDPGLVLGEGLLQLLAAAGGGTGCLLVLEDLQWADQDTIALVQYLAGAISDLPVLLAVSARDDQPGLSQDPDGPAAAPPPGTGRGHHRGAAPPRRRRCHASGRELRRWSRSTRRHQGTAPVQGRGSAPAGGGSARRAARRRAGQCRGPVDGDRPGDRADGGTGPCGPARRDSRRGAGPGTRLDAAGPGERPGRDAGRPSGSPGPRWPLGIAAAAAIGAVVIGGAFADAQPSPASSTAPGVAANSHPFTPNEDQAHEQGESVAREAREDAGQVPTVP